MTSSCHIPSKKKRKIILLSRLSYDKNLDYLQPASALVMQLQYRVGLHVAGGRGLGLSVGNQAAAITGNKMGGERPFFLSP